jgi:NADH:ubiquinone oxidoreductase subunit E
MRTHRRYSFKNQHFVGEEGRLIPLLQQVQAEDGYLRPERLKEIHEQSGIPAPIYGVATFYAQFG